MSDFKIEDRGGIMVLSDRIGCRPATHAEVEFYAEIDQLRREVAEALKWRDYYRSKYLAPRDWVDDETKLRRELAEVLEKLDASHEALRLIQKLADDGLQVAHDCPACYACSAIVACYEPPEALKKLTAESEELGLYDEERKP